MLHSSRMVLLISLIVLSILLSFITIFFTGMAQTNPYNYFYLPLFIIGYFSILATIFWGLLLLFAHKYKNKDHIDPSIKLYKSWTVLFIRSMLLSTWTKFDKKGFNRIPKNTPCLFLFNHSTLLDAYMIIHSLYPKQYAMIATSKMKKVPFIGPLATSLGCLYIDTEDIESYKNIINLSIDFIKNKNTSIVLSPEGFLNKTNHLSEFKNGGFKIALATNCPIVCLYFDGALDFAKRKNPFKKVKLSAKVIDIIPKDDYQNMNANELAQYTRNIYLDYQKEK